MLNEIASIYNNPPAGYHFSVIFNYDFQSIWLEPGSFLPSIPFIPLPNDFLFQEVSGLSCKSSNGIEIKEAGNGITHQRPSMEVEYEDLVLKRGLCAASLVTQWVKASIGNLPIAPVNILIMLMNDIYVPIHSWFVNEAYPVGWEFSSLDATQSEVMTETITLKYERFNTVEAIVKGDAAALAATLALKAVQNVKR